MSIPEPELSKKEIRKQKRIERKEKWRLLSDGEKDVPLRVGLMCYSILTIFFMGLSIGIGALCNWNVYVAVGTFLLFAGIILSGFYDKDPFEGLNVDNSKKED